MRKSLGAALVAACCAVVAFAVAVPAPMARSAPAGESAFGVPRIVDPIHTYGEPDIKVAPNGDMHVSGPQGTGVQRSIWNVSHDNGDSYRVVQGLPLNQAIAPNKSSLGPGGGDTEIAISRDNTVFFSDLWALTCFTAGVSHDAGATVSSNPIGCSHPPGDRQWMAVFEPTAADKTTSPYKGKTPLVYFTYDNVINADQLDKTTDGINYSGVTTYADGNGYSIANGNIVVDQHTGDVMAVVAHQPADDTKFGLALAVGEPSDDAGGVTFHYNTITDKLLGDPQMLFPVLAQDTDRNLYAVWSEDASTDAKGNPDCPGAKQECFHVYYSYASAADGWKAWSAPVQLDQPPALTNIFPWVAAGGPGIIDVVWYGTDQRLNPSDQKNQAWHVFMSQVDKANTVKPHVAQSRVTPHPMHYNDICLLGTGCITQIGNRNLADFFQVTIDHEGRARIVYDDTSNKLVQENFPGPIDHEGAPVVSVATQNTGLNAWTGQPLKPAESAAPIAGTSDPSGDALFKPLGGTNVPAADITDARLSLEGDTLHVRVTTAGGPLSAVAQAGGGTAAQIFVRWQMGDVLYYAGVEQGGGGAPTFYAGPTKTVDLCSVSACDPHYLVYPAPPAGGTAVKGTVTGSGPVTYDIAVPASVVGNASAASLLEEVAAYTTVSATSVTVPLTNAQADADLVPIEVEGTRTFNYQAAAVAAGQPAPPSSGTLPATGGFGVAASLVGLGVIALALLLRPRRRSS